MGDAMLTLEQGWILVIGFGVLLTLAVMFVLGYMEWKDNHE